MSNSGYQPLVGDSKDLKIAIRDPRVIRAECFLDQFNLQANRYESALAAIVAAINALGNAELPISFLWFLTTDVAEVGLGVTDLTLSKRPQDAITAFTGAMVATAAVSVMAARTFYAEEMDAIEDAISTVEEEEKKHEKNARELLFEAMRFRVLVNDEKQFKTKIDSLLPKHLLFRKAEFLAEMETAYQVLFGPDSKEDKNDLKRKITLSDFAFDNKFRPLMTDKIKSAIHLACVSKSYYLRPILAGDTGAAVNTGILGGLLMSGTLFPAWWSVHSLIVSSELNEWSSLRAFWELTISLIVAGLGVGVFMGRQQNTQTRREQLAETLREVNQDLNSAKRNICQLNLEICQQHFVSKLGLLSNKPGLPRSNSSPQLQNPLKFNELKPA